MRKCCLLLLPTLLALGPVLLNAGEKAKFYDPIEKKLEDWTLAVDPQLLDEKNKDVADRAFEALANHLQRVRYIVPPDRLRRLQKFAIWIDWNHELGNMQYHPDRGWLISNGRRKQSPT